MLIEKGMEGSLLKESLCCIWRVFDIYLCQHKNEKPQNGQKNKWFQNILWITCKNDAGNYWFYYGFQRDTVEMKSPRYRALTATLYSRWIISRVEMKSPRNWALQQLCWDAFFVSWICRNKKPEKLGIVASYHKRLSLWVLSGNGKPEIPGIVTW